MESLNPSAGVGVVLVVFAPVYPLVVVSVVFVFGVLTMTMRQKVVLDANQVVALLDFVFVLFEAEVRLDSVFALFQVEALLDSVLFAFFQVEVLLGFVFVLFQVEVLMAFLFLLEGKGRVAIRLAIVPVSVRHGCENDLCL